jgi:hypothetical protein
MRTYKSIKLATAAVFGISMAAAGVAHAGRGGSPEAIQLSIQSGSPDAIKAELERAEFLVCGVCVDMVRPLVDNGDAGIRQVAAWWLARRAVSRQIQADMIARLGQPNSIAARNAADVLGEFHQPSAIPALAAGLSNPLFSGEARAAMAKALGVMNKPASLAPLYGALGDSNPQVKTGALQALQSMSGLRNGAAVVPLLTDGDAAVRAEAAITLGTFRATVGTDALVAALRSDPSATVRKHAAWALGEMKANTSLAGPSLQHAVSSDPSPFVRSLASAALTRLSPQ